MRLLLLLAMMDSPVAVAGVKFVRSCELLAAPSLNAGSVCRQGRSASILKAKKATGGLYFVETADCQGYVPAVCLARDTSSSEGNNNTGAGPDTEETGKIGRSRYSARTQRESSSFEEPTLYFGPMLGLGGLWARPSNGATQTRGSAFDFGLSLSIPLMEEFRVTIQPVFCIYGLSRTVDGTGSIDDSNPAEYSQKINFFGGSLLGGVKLSGERGAEKWWLDVGFSYLMAASAKQTDNFGNETSFTSNDKLGMILLGPSGDFPIGSGLWASGFLQVFYNLGSRGGSQLLGGRLLLSLQLGV